jgi:hypothetical protein
VSRSIDLPQYENRRTGSGYSPIECYGILTTDTRRYGDESKGRNDSASLQGPQRPFTQSCLNNVSQAIPCMAELGEIVLAYLSAVSPNELHPLQKVIVGQFSPEPSFKLTQAKLLLLFTI